MSPLLLIRQALEMQLAAIDSFPTVWENEAKEAPASPPSSSCIRAAEHARQLCGFGATLYCERGFFQISLLLSSSGPATARHAPHRAEVIRHTIQTGHHTELRAVSTYSSRKLRRSVRAMVDGLLGRACLHPVAGVGSRRVNLAASAVSSLLKGNPWQSHKAYSSRRGSSAKPQRAPSPPRRRDRSCVGNSRPGNWQRDKYYTTADEINSTQQLVSVRLGAKLNQRQHRRAAVPWHLQRHSSRRSCAGTSRRWRRSAALRSPSPAPARPTR
jgi:hypothetical protein